MYQVRFRYYNAALGTWLTHDQEGYAQGANLYQYGLGDPVDNLDPEGLKVYTSKPIVLPGDQVVRVHRYEASPLNPMVWIYGGEAAGTYVGTELYQYNESAPDKKGRIVGFEYPGGVSAAQKLQDWLRQNPNAFYGTYAEFKNMRSTATSEGSDSPYTDRVEPSPLSLYRPIVNRVRDSGGVGYGNEMSVPDPARNLSQPSSPPDAAAAMAHALSTYHPAEKWQQVEGRANRQSVREGGAGLAAGAVAGVARGTYEFLSGMNEARAWRWKEKGSNCVGWYMSGHYPSGQRPLGKEEALVLLRDWFGISA
jgi:hypothetical protein